MSQIKYKDKTYGGAPFAFFPDKTAAEAARQAGRIVPGQIVITLDDTIGQMMAASVGYDNTESGLDATDVQDALDEVAGKVDNKWEITARPSSHVDDIPASRVTIGGTCKVDGKRYIYFKVDGVSFGYVPMDKFLEY